jgi:hypothetical protein
MKSYSVICLDCAQRGAVNKLTAGLVCRCGGQVDLYYPSSASQRRLIASRAPGASFATWMGRTAAPEGMESSPGSNEYAGPPPHGTEMTNHEGKIRCPSCHGSGNDITDVGEGCRECDGTGFVTPTTTPSDPEVYRHRYAPDGERNKQTKVPFVGTRKAARNQLYQRVREANPGLTPREAMGVVDETLRRYPEVR